MTVLQAVIFGVVQGLTEFLPVSSSGHLVIVPEFLNMQPPPLSFDVLVHVATLVAVVAYFARDLANLAAAFVMPGRMSRRQAGANRRLVLWLLVGSVPAALAGFLLGDFFESLFSRTAAVGFLLILTGCLLLLADLVINRVARRRKLDGIGLVDALVIGLFQALAIAPGISRSGSTISAGVYLGLPREDAARFSFLLSIPVILGAGLVELGDLNGGFQTGLLWAYVAGGLAALVSGFFAVFFLMRYLKAHRLRPFAAYVLVVGSFVVLLSLY